MPPRFDADRLSLVVSVADLLERSLLRSLGFGNRGGYERMWLGQAIHSRYQEEARAEDATYRSEVPLSTRLTHRGWDVTVQGRADGLRRAPDGALVVEEIKSVRRGGQLSAAAREIYEGQALLYAWMLGREGGEAAGGGVEVRAELVLIEIGSDEVQREELEVRPRALGAVVRRRLNALLREFDSRRMARDARREAAGRLVFPYERMRPGQQRIVEAVERSLRQREHLLVEAPTGLGKTVAALYPGLRFALAEEKRLFVLTAKTLQQEMATTVLQLLNDGKSFNSIRLRAKAKMCANDELLCHEEYCAYARDYYSKLQLSRLVPGLLDSSGTLLPDDIFAAARAGEVCPFEVSLELAAASQVVVCDYNYAFDPHVALSDFGADRDLSDVILVIDEIHNLVERGRGYYSPSLSSRRAAEVAAAVESGGDAVHRAMAGLCRDLARLIESSVSAALEEAGGAARAVETALPEEELWALRPDFDEAFVDYLEYRRETSSFRADDPFVALYFELLRFLDGLLAAEGDAFSRYVERAGDDARLEILCKDPSRFLGRILRRAHAVVGLSATLSPHAFYRDLLGLDPERATREAVPSPFPPENRAVVIDDSVATTWRERPLYFERIATRLGAFAEQVPGNCLALFPSYDFLREVSKHLSVRRRILIQERASTDREREEILALLRSALAGDFLLLAVAGGVFAEGVDYPGDMLHAVAVVGPCLPAVSLERQLLKSYYQARFERGFEYAFVVPGMTRVVQAAGRLIRSAAETGVIALFDRRFLAGPYRDHLPGDWLPAEGAEGLIGTPADVAATFFSELRAPGGPPDRRP